MKKSIIAAGAASIALAAMPVLGVFATPDVTDTIEVTIQESCTFTSGGADTTYEYSGTNADGQVDPLNNSTNVHSFTVFCNDNDGYTVSATAESLTASGISDEFAYVATLPSSGVDGKWHATVAAATGNTNTLTIEQLPAGGAATDIVTIDEASAAGGETFTVAYSAYIGTATPAGTYSGHIEYTLTPNA